MSLQIHKSAVSSFYVLIVTTSIQCLFNVSILAPKYFIQTVYILQPSKTCFHFWNPYKNQFIKTSFVEMLGLLNFLHMTTSTISFESLDKILIGDVMNKNTDIIIFIQKLKDKALFISRRSGAASFEHILG